MVNEAVLDQNVAGSTHVDAVSAAVPHLDATQDRVVPFVANLNRVTVAKLTIEDDALDGGVWMVDA